MKPETFQLPEENHVSEASYEALAFLYQTISQNGGGIEGAARGNLPPPAVIKQAYPAMIHEQQEVARFVDKERRKLRALHGSARDIGKKLDEFRLSKSIPQDLIDATKIQSDYIKLVYNKVVTRLVDNSEKQVMSMIGLVGADHEVDRVDIAAYLVDEYILNPIDDYKGFINKNPMLKDTNRILDKMEDRFLKIKTKLDSPETHAPVQRNVNQRPKLRAM